MNIVNHLQDLLQLIPSVGEKTAQRYISFILKADDSFAENLGNAIISLKKKVSVCPLCQNYITETCSQCSNPKKQQNVICVVRDPEDLTALETTGHYNGLYHVLHGLISPMEGKGPEDIKLKELFSRLEPVDELILALDSSVEAEATCLYIKKLLKDIPIKITRIGFGLGVGVSLNYADSLSIIKALDSRQNV